MFSPKQFNPFFRPPETQTTLVQSDPTWAAEYEHFENLVVSATQSDLSTDTWLLNQINRLSINI